jgi:hypothetical protein
VQIVRVLVCLVHIIQIPISIPFGFMIIILDRLLSVIYQGAMAVCAYHFINNFFLDFFCAAVEQSRDELKQSSGTVSHEIGGEGAGPLRQGVRCAV